MVLKKKWPCHASAHEDQYDDKYLECTRNIRIDGASGFVGEGTSVVVYLERARINEETETREIGLRRYYNPLARIFRTIFVLIIAYS